MQKFINYYEYIFIIKYRELIKMPRQDGTGPLGQGPRTGRGLGRCNNGMRRRFGRGFDREFGFRRKVSLTKDEEKKILEAELKELDLDKQDIEKKLKEME